MAENPDYILVLTTIDDRTKAEELATAVVEARLAACAQLSSPIQSVYHWNSVIEKNEETQIWMKTRGDLYPKLEKFIQDFHSYEVPEIVAIPIVAGLPNYLTWVQKETLD